MMLTEKRQKYQHYHLKKYDKYEYLAGEEILSSDERKVIQQAKFTYSPLEKQTKMIEDQEEEQAWKA